MSDEILSQEKRTEVLKARNEVMDQELSIEQKKAAIREAKAMYGKDWKKMIGSAVKSLRVNKDTMHSLHSMGFGGNELRELNDPRRWRKNNGGS